MVRNWFLSGLLIFLGASTAMAKSLHCPIGLFGAQINAIESVELPFYPAGHVDHAFTLRLFSFRALVHPWRIDEQTTSDTVYRIQLYLNDPLPALGLEAFYGKIRRGSETNYFSIRGNREGTVKATPAFIDAVKRLGRWGQPPFDAVRDGSIDGDYFYDHGGIEIAQDVVNHGVPHLLFFQLMGMCRLEQ